MQQRGGDYRPWPLAPETPEQWRPPLEEVESALAILGENGSSLDPQTSLEERFVQRLKAERFECADMRPIFQGEPSPPFWRRDLHISLPGQVLDAGALEPVVTKLLER